MSIDNKQPKLILALSKGRMMEVLWEEEVKEEYIRKKMKDSKPMVLWFAKSGG